MKSHRADLATCYTLRPETVRITGKCAPGKLSELAAGDATEASLNDRELQAVSAPLQVDGTIFRAERGAQSSWSTESRAVSVSKVKAVQIGIFEDDSHADRFARKLAYVGSLVPAHHLLQRVAENLGAIVNRKPFDRVTRRTLQFNLD